MIALQVVRTSFGFHLRKYRGSWFPPPGLIACGDFIENLKIATAKSGNEKYV